MDEPATIVEHVTSEYETPRIEDHGDLAELTAAVGNNGGLDGSYPVGTPNNGMRFSQP
jgi:hypothetical protein